MSARLDNMHLRELLKRANGTKRFRLGHNTEGYVNPQFENGYAIVYYHGNAVARVEPWDIAVSDCGWTNSPTTRQRINAVLADNHVPFYVAQRNYVDVLFKRDGTRVRDFDSFASFKMVAGEWVLDD